MGVKVSIDVFKWVYLKKIAYGDRGNASLLKAPCVHTQ